ncbi:MAG: squalene synthase HpnC [Sterolibacteriaceae bacterium MAG5]|nr:squalene synthase HpnC [Candidatus Nitricoxidireducens bremensis]
MSVDHYENFPVASVLLPPALREPVAAIYVFARSADDFADEGELPPEERLRRLDAYKAELDAIEAGRPTTHPVFLRLRPVIAAHGLPLPLFRDLLDAFSQDVVKTRYASYAELIDYCRRSADPVGRLLLHLFKAATPENLRRSDCVCSALQLINHWQDVAIDWAKPRVYLPQEDLDRFGVADAQIAAGLCDERWRELMRFQVDRARALMLEGAPLGRDLPGRMGLEIRAIVAGGLRILDKIEAVDYDIFRRRPVLEKPDWIRILWRAVFP